MPLFQYLFGRRYKLAAAQSQQEATDRELATSRRAVTTRR